MEGSIQKRLQEQAKHIVAIPQKKRLQTRLLRIQNGVRGTNKTGLLSTCGVKIKDRVLSESS